MRHVIPVMLAGAVVFVLVMRVVRPPSHSIAGCGCSDDTDLIRDAIATAETYPFYSWSGVDGATDVRSSAGTTVAKKILTTEWWINPVGSETRWESITCSISDNGTVEDDPPVPFTCMGSDPNRIIGFRSDGVVVWKKADNGN